MNYCVLVLSYFSHVWLCDPMDYSLPGSSVHGDSAGKNTGVGSHAFLQGIFTTQESNPGLPHCRWILYHLSYQWNPQTELNSTIKEHTPGWSEIHICDAGWFDICRLINVIITNDRIKSKHWGFPSGTNSKQTTCQCRRLKRCRFNPWVRKTPWSRKQQTIPVFLPGKFHGQRSLASYSPRDGKESDMT